MELILANHSSYPRIGDTSEDQLLRRAIAEWEKGERSDAALRAAEDKMVERALHEQTAAELEVVTDGQIRWYDPISHLAGKLEGIRINGLLRFFDTNFYFRQPVVRPPIRRTGPLLVEEFRFAHQRSSRPVKVVLTGPYTLARLSIQEDGAAGGLEHLVEQYAKALAEEVTALAAAEAPLIQIEEPSLLRHPRDISLVEQALALLATGKGSAQLSLTLHFGEVATLYTSLQKLPVDILGLDFTYGSRLVELIAGAGTTKTLALGLVDGRNTRLEDAGVVARQLEHMARKAGLARAYLTFSCGLEYLPRDRAQMKLKHLATIKRTFLGTNA